MKIGQILVCIGLLFFFFNYVANQWFPGDYGAIKPIFAIFVAAIVVMAGNGLVDVLVPSQRDEE